MSPTILRRFDNSQPLWIGVAIAAIFWLLDSGIHHFGYGEAELELIPTEFNELWMRTLICALFVGFGGYATLWSRRKHRMDTERDRQQRIQQTLTEALGEFVTVCAGCKQIKQQDKDWTPIESFIDSRVNKQTSHGMCPMCRDEFYQGLGRSETARDG